MILYGIKNCDTVKKARRWLDANDVAFDFHDVRADGLDQATIKSWLQNLSWEVLLNKRGTTWRKLEDPRKEQLDETRSGNKDENNNDENNNNKASLRTF